TKKDLPFCCFGRILSGVKVLSWASFSGVLAGRTWKPAAASRRSIWRPSCFRIAAQAPTPVKDATTAATAHPLIALDLMDATSSSPATPGLRPNPQSGAGSRDAAAEETRSAAARQRAEPVAESRALDHRAAPGSGRQRAGHVDGKGAFADDAELDRASGEDL